MKSFVTAAAMAGFLLAPHAASQSLQLVNTTLGEASGAAERADLPRGHRVSLRVTGHPGDPVLILLSPTPPPAAPPVFGGRPLLVDPATAVILLNGLLPPGAVVGPAGTFDLAFTVPVLPLGLHLWLQAATSGAGGLTLGNGLELEVIDAHGFDFESGAQGWVGGFADYPVGQEEFYRLAWNHAALPGGLPGNGMRMHGDNHSDDLFMFLKRRVDGLTPGQVYRVDSAVRLASQYPEELLGVGGAPGVGVYLHAGASMQEPLAVVQPGSTPPYYVMNIDKGNQARGGTQSAVIGNIATPGAQVSWQIIARQSTRSIAATADANGGIWLHIGTDSGFEAVTEVFYQDLVFRVRR